MVASTQPRRLSCIVLAAGANVRLQGIVAPFHKPLILVDGLPLVMHAVRHAHNDWGVDDKNITLVVSPENAMAITRIVPDTCRFIIQPKPKGVIEAIARGIDLNSDETLILCADNTFEGIRTDGVRAPAVAIKNVSREESRRFTRVRTSDNPEDRVMFLDATDGDFNVTWCWVGPLLLETAKLLKTLRASPARLVDLLNDAVEPGNVDLLPSSCSDVGIPEALV